MAPSLHWHDFVVDLTARRLDTRQYRHLDMVLLLSNNYLTLKPLAVLAPFAPALRHHC